MQFDAGLAGTDLSLLIRCDAKISHFLCPVDKMISSKTIQLWRASRSRCPRYSFTTSAAYREVESRKPPLLAKFQTDLKEAMKAKDKTK